MTEADILDLLRARHRKDWKAEREWAFFTHVRTPWGSQERVADAVAMNMWSSKRYAVHGFEVKVSRGDWLRELKQPRKWEGIGQWCDYWSIAIAEKSMVKPEELPAKWGLMAADRGTLRVIRHPKRLEPRELNRGFIAALVRRFSYEEREHEAKREALLRAIRGTP